MEREIEEEENEEEQEQEQGIKINRCAIRSHARFLLAVSLFERLEVLHLDRQFTRQLLF